MFINEPRGVGKFVLNAIREMNSSNLFYITIFSNKDIDIDICNELEKLQNVCITIKPLTIFPNIGILWFLFLLPRLINKSGIDIFWATSVVYPLGIVSKVKVLLTVHDMVYHDFRETMSVKNRIFMFAFHDRSINNADMLWAVSNYTKEEIEKRYRKRKSQNIFVGSSINTNLFRKMNIEKGEQTYFLNKLGITRKYILFVGTLEPRKNLKFLLTIIPDFLLEEDYQLVIVGGRGWGNTSISNIINNPNYPKDRIIFTGYITDDDLVFLYNMASCYVSTSLNEGFGLPQLEALSCGCPVVTANNSAMTEVVNNYGLLVNGWNRDVWISNIRRACLIGRVNDLKLLEKYNWKKIVKDLYQFINLH